MAITSSYRIENHKDKKSLAKLVKGSVSLIRWNVHSFSNTSTKASEPPRSTSNSRVAGNLYSK